ncbi:hypothetical protein [Runella sp.]|uniref:hypothetical protein n=1 Tax=Runella sp. TaxID=1960881 RepID=UPI003D0A2AED
MFAKSTIYWFFFILMIGFGIFKGCRPKDNEVGPSIDSTAISPCILLSERINNVLYRTYEYDSTRRLVRMLEYSANFSANQVVKRYTFEYSKENTLIRLRETNIQTRDQSYIYELNYANRTTLSTIYSFRVFNSGAVIDDTLKLTYTKDNHRVSELQSSKGITSKWEYDTAANVKKWLLHLPTKTTDSLIAEYGDHDDKVNIYAFSEGMQLLNLLNGRAQSKRNPLNYTLLKESTDVVYQYNDKRVPTLRVLKVKSNNNVLRETVYSYELDCK